MTARPRRGAVLLEVLLALALFVGAATLTLGAARTALDALERAQTDLLAADLARAKMAELEAGLVALPDLRGETIDAVGSLERFGPDRGDDAPHARRWTIEIETERTEFTGLTLVALTVREARGAPGGAGRPEEPGASYTLRQLVALREDAAGEYELDDAVRDLPAPAPEDGP